LISQNTVICVNIAIYFPISSSRSVVDMAFAAFYCSSYILTAAKSTFAHWTVYLSNKIEHVYYNKVYLKPNSGGHERDHEKDDFFKKSWIPLYYNVTKDAVIADSY